MSAPTVAAATSPPSSSSSPSSTLFSSPLPPPQPRESFLFPYFNDLASSAASISSGFRHLAVRRSSRKGRYLTTNKNWNVGELIFSEASVISVSDDPTVCVACGARHTSKSAPCALVKQYFSSLRLNQIDAIASATDYPPSRIREVYKFVGISYHEIFSPLRGAPKTWPSEEERKSKSSVWCLLGLDDGSTIVERTDAQTGAITYETVSTRAPDRLRTQAATMIHNSLPLTYKKHYPVSLLETVINVLDLNAHATVDDDGIAGDALHPFFAMIEHSCRETCAWTSEKKRMRISAMREIRVGENGKAKTKPTASSTMNFNFNTALVRGLSSSFEKSLQMNPPPTPIDVSLAEKQHHDYMDVLKQILSSTGAKDGTLVEVTAHDDLPDCNFIEDTAVLIDDTAIISRPGAASRLPEIDEVSRVLSTIPFAHRFEITAPATLDGGDVMFTGRHLFIGESKRTNHEATLQVQRYFAKRAANGKDPVAFSVHSLPVTAGLHLKSIISILADGVLVVADTAPALLIRQAIEKIDATYIFITVPDVVSSNVLRVRDTLLVQEGFPKSETILRKEAEKHKLQVKLLNMSELIKADGALTCGSLLTTLSSSSDDARGDTSISINYASPYQPTSRRRAYLLESYGFVCQCALCVGEEPDKCRAFKCACGKGLVHPYGQPSEREVEKWKCTSSSCTIVQTSETIAQYLSAEQEVFTILHTKKDVEKIKSMDEMLDELQNEPRTVELLLDQIRKVVDAVVHGLSASSSSSTSSSPLRFLSSRHYLIHILLEYLIEFDWQSLVKLCNVAGGTTSSSRTSISDLFENLFTYQQQRVENVEYVSGETHWSRAREHDRYGEFLCQSRRVAQAKDQFQIAHDVHHRLFGEEADCTQRAKARLLQAK